MDRESIWEWVKQQLGNRVGGSSDQRQNKGTYLGDIKKVIFEAGKIA